MEAYSSHSSSPSSAYSSPKAKNPKLPHSAYSTVLHTVQKSQTKPWKKPVAPLPPKPPRVYKVDPINFRDLVQKLTGATDLQSRRLQSVAPPPLNVAMPPSSDGGMTKPTHLQQPTSRIPFSAAYQRDMISEMQEMKPQKMSNSEEAVFSLEMNISPSSHNWYSFPLLSPGSISSLDQIMYGSLAL